MMPFSWAARSLSLLLVVLFISACASTPKVVPPKIVTHYSGQQDSETFNNADGLKLYGQYWLPSEPVTEESLIDNYYEDPKAVVLILHGTSFHSGVYDHVGKYLASHGYAVYGTDLQGWGRSEGKGKSGYIESHNDYVRDVKQVLDRIERRFPRKKVFVIGESLGANVALYGYLRGQFDLAGFVFSGAGYRPNPKFLGIRYPRFMLVIPTAMTSMWGNMFPNWPTMPSDLGITMVVKDEHVEQALKDDPLVAHNWLPASYVSAFTEADRYNVNNIERVDIPILLLHGEKDVLVPVKSSQEIYDRVSTEDKTLRVLEDTHHATLVESTRFDLLEEITGWLEARK